MIYEGHLVDSTHKFAIVVARFNSFITDKLVEGALDTIERHGGNKQNVDVFKVPGCFEVPMAAHKLASKSKYDAIICLGALIRGETPHFDYIAAECTKGIAAIALQAQIPVTYGIITANTVDQAVNRAGVKVGNKGADAALAAIEMVDLYDKIDDNIRQ